MITNSHPIKPSSYYSNNNLTTMERCPFFSMKNIKGVIRPCITLIDKQTRVFNTKDEALNFLKQKGYIWITNISSSRSFTVNLRTQPDKVKAIALAHPGISFYPENGDRITIDGSYNLKTSLRFKVMKGNHNYTGD